MTIEILRSKDAANYIGCASHTLKQSRLSGILFGVQSPVYLKMGRVVSYKKETLDNWLAQFPEKLNTAQ